RGGEVRDRVPVGNHATGLRGAVGVDRVVDVRHVRVAGRVEASVRVAAGGGGGPRDVHARKQPVVGYRGATVRGELPAAETVAVLESTVIVRPAEHVRAADIDRLLVLREPSAVLVELHPGDERGTRAPRSPVAQARRGRALELFER